MLYISEDENREFRWPSHEYTLSKTEIRKLKECYRTMFDLESLSLVKVIQTISFYHYNFLLKTFFRN
jgi:hypothetical protein